MTTRDAFTPEEWGVLEKTLHQPSVAVMMAAPGGAWRDFLAIARGIFEAEEKFANSELVVALLNGMDVKGGGLAQPGAGSFMDEMIANLRQASKIVQAKATAQEVEDFRAMVIFLAEKVAKAATVDEKRVLDEIKLALWRKA